MFIYKAGGGFTFGVLHRKERKRGRKGRQTVEKGLIMRFRYIETGYRPFGGGKDFRIRLRNGLRACRIGVMTPIMAGRTGAKP